MGIRRSAAHVAVAAVMAGGVSLVAAPAASAATYQVDGCAAGSFTMLQGDTVVLVFEDYNDSNNACSPPVSGFQTQSATIDQVIVDNDLCATVTFTASNGFVSVGGAANLRVDASDTSTITQAVPRTCGDALPAEEFAAIPDWVQGYGRAVTDSCRAGWAASWEMWMNGGTGGYVCTRSIPSLG